MSRWKRLYESQGFFVCPYCLKQFPLSEATVDHKNPFSRSHDNSSENKVLCCKEDNSKKGMLTESEYMLFLLLDRVRNGQKNERDLEILDRYKRELCSIFYGTCKKFR